MNLAYHIKRLPAEIKDKDGNIYNLYIQKNISKDKMFKGVVYYYVGYECEKKEVFNFLNSENVNLKEALKSMYRYLKKQE